MPKPVGKTGKVAPGTAITPRRNPTRDHCWVEWLGKLRQDDLVRLMVRLAEEGVGLRIDQGFAFLVRGVKENDAVVLDAMLVRQAPSALQRGLVIVDSFGDLRPLAG